MAERPITAPATNMSKIYTISEEEIKGLTPHSMYTLIAAGYMKALEDVDRELKAGRTVEYVLKKLHEDWHKREFANSLTHLPDEACDKSCSH